MEVGFARRARELLEAGGLDVEYHESDAAHEIDPAHVPAAIAWLGATLTELTNLQRLEKIPLVPSELRLDDPAAVAALYDPLRYRIFRLLAAPRTVAELAAEIGMPANRLYYHVKRLVDCGLVQQVDARASGRHTERIYGRAAERIRFSGDLELYEGGLLRGIADELDEWLQARGREDDAGLGLVPHADARARHRARAGDAAARPDRRVRGAATSRARARGATASSACSPRPEDE